MRKYRMLGAVAVVVAVSVIAVAASGASANVWLEAGKELTEAKFAQSHGRLVFHAVLLGIETSVECSALLIGTVGPKTKDLTSLIESLDGSEKDLVACIWLKGIECTTPEVHLGHLPWSSELLATSPISDDFLADGPNGNPAWILLCKKGFFKEVLCEQASSKATFTGNGTNGARFEYTKAGTSTTCNAGAEGWITGSGEVLGFAVS